MRETRHLEYGAEGHLQKEKYYESGTFQQAGSKYYDLTPFYSLKGAKAGVPQNDFNGTFAAANYQSYTDYTLDQGHNRVSTLTQPGALLTNYTLEPTSHRYDLVDGVDHLHDGEGNTTFDGNLYYVYDFRNRLSEVYRYVPPTTEAGFSAGTGVYRGETRYRVPEDRLRRLRGYALSRWLQPASRVGAGYANARGAESLASDPAATGGTLQLVAVYGYDPFNRRVVRAVAGQPTLYSTYDQWEETEEISQAALGQAAQNERVYLWGKSLDELLCYARPQGSSWQRLFAHEDRMASIHRLVDGSGVTVESYRYGSYGQVSVYDGVGSY